MCSSDLTGAAATFANNVVNPIHYLRDGNSDEQLRLKIVEGVEGFYRSGSQTRFDQTLGSGSLTLLNAFFGGRVHTSAGIDRDYFRQNRNRATNTNAATGETQVLDLEIRLIASAGGYDVPYEPFNRTYATYIGRAHV